MGDTRWVDYIVTVRRSGNPSLTWSQYLAALEHGRPQQVSHPERPYPREPYPREQQRQPHAGQAATKKVEAAARAPDKKALKLEKHRRNVALILGQRTDEEAEVQRRIQRRRRQQEETDCQAMAKRWRDNRGVAAALVPLLPPELWAHILRQGRDERAQLEAWVAWANATLIQLVVVWFRTGGQRNNKWLGNLVGKNGGISSASTDMATRFAPWCKAILRPGEENEPLHYSGASGAPAAFVDVYVHMLSMMNYLGFHNVIERLQRILRLRRGAYSPTATCQSTYRGHRIAMTKTMSGMRPEVPTPGQQPPRPQKPFVARAGRPVGHQGN